MPFNVTPTTIETDVTEIAKNGDNYLQILDKQNGDKLELGQELSFKTSSNALKELRAQDVFIAEDSVWIGDHISNNSAHHARYSDSEAIAAVNGEETLSVDIAGDADTLDGIDSTGFIQTNDTIDADTIDGTELADIAEGYNTAVTKTSDHTAIDSQVVLADATNNDINITLPSPTDGQLVTVKKIDSSNNAVNIVTPGDETIDGHSSIVITNQFAARETVSNGTNYFII